MTILIDIDDTITNFDHILINRLNTLYNTHYSISDIKTWGWFRDTFSAPWLPLNDKSFWDEVTVFETAITVIEEWVKQGHQVYLVTASHFTDTLGYKIQTTLDQFDPMLINERNVVVCQNKQLINGDVRIDDGLHNFSENSINLLYNQPWNQSCDLGSIITRVSDWNEIRDKIAELNIEKNRQAE